MKDKIEVAKILAERHYQTDPTVIKIFRLKAESLDQESQPDEPIKLLEISTETIPSGIMPLGFEPHPASGIDYSSIIIEVTPEEFDAIQQETLPLPNNWHLGEFLPNPVSV
jgi:hypothetical protein